MARAERWTQTGRANSLIWGAFNGMRVFYYCSINLKTKTFACSCKSARYPCNHGVGLWLLAQQMPAQFTAQPMPDWLHPAKQHPELATVQFFTPQSANPKQWEKNAAERLRYIKLGMQDLAAWLLDLIDNGLASAPDRPTSYWLDMSRRLNDSYCPAISKQIEHLPKLITQHTNWPPLLLDALSKLYLLTQSFVNFDTLPAATQFDLCTTVGWHHSKLPSATDEAVTDQWLVVARTLTSVRKRQMVTVTVWGQQSARFAQLTGIAHTRQKPDMHLTTGVTFNGTLHFVDSELGLQAYPIDIDTAIAPTSPWSQTAPTFDSIFEDYQTHYLQHPWLVARPVLVHNASVARHNKQFILQGSTRDALPLNPDNKHNWHLYASSRTAPLAVFGWWDGTSLDAVSYCVEGQWLPLSTWAEVAA